MPFHEFAGAFNSPCSFVRLTFSLLAYLFVCDCLSTRFLDQEIPQLDRVFAELNSTIKDTVVVSDSAKQSVDDASAAGVQDVNYTQYYEQVRTSTTPSTTSRSATSASRQLWAELQSWAQVGGQHRGNKLICRARVTSTSSQRLLHKMTNSRAVLIARLHLKI